MLAVRLPDMKTATSLLFLKETFHDFPVYEATFQTRCSYTIDGWRNGDYFSPEENEEAKENYVLWRDIQAICFSMIKGKKLPLRFKIVFRAPRELVAKLLAESGLNIVEEQVESIHFIITYKDGALSCTTGSSLRVFTLDKTLDKLWDSYILKMFDETGISYKYE